MTLVAYVVLFVLVAIMGAGLPGPGDASLIAAGARAGEGRLDIWIVLAAAMVAWMLGSMAGYAVGVRQGRGLLEHPGPLTETRLKLLAKGDRAFGRHTFMASMTLPAFVSGIFRVRFSLFMLGALAAGIAWIGMYAGISYFLGEEIARLVGNVGTAAVLGVLVVVAAGLAIRVWVARRRNARHGRPAEQGVSQQHDRAAP
jgi:membrane protein DedA with SNARE-associated domain